MAENRHPIGEVKAVRRSETLVNKMDEAYKKALSIFNDNEISPEDFKLYKPEIVAADLKYVKTTEMEIEKKNVEEAKIDPDKKLKLKLAVVLEAIMLEQAELSDWLGENVFTVKASRYDDLCNGVDIVAGFGQENGWRLPLAIDVTLGDATKKIKKIKKEIEKGKLTMVKYFYSADDNFRGILRGVPKVVVAVDKGTVVRLAELWLKGQKKILGADVIRLQILDEISEQLKAFIEYAKSAGKDGVAKIYAEILSQIDAEIESNQDLYKQPGAQIYKSGDKTYRALTASLQEMLSAPQTEEVDR